MGEEYVGNSFELFLLDGRSGNSIVALGRRGADTAIEYIPLNGSLQPLVDFGRRVGGTMTGVAQRPTPDELKTFGANLFNFVFIKSLLDLYYRLPAGQISLQILSDHAQIREVPWEYISPPNYPLIPHRERSIIRVHPTCGVYQTTRKKFAKVRVLLVSADPVDQPGVSLDEVLATIKRTFELQLPQHVEIKVVAGATLDGLLATIAQESFDVFHFYGHGTVDQKNVGSLMLQDIKTGVSELISSHQLATAFAGKGVQLAVLSACLTGAGNHANDFDVISTALIEAGIPAVIANQYPIPNKTISPFIGSVYGSLINQGDIDMAVAEGRARLAAGLQKSTHLAVLEWGIPVLYRLSDARQLFEI